MTLGGPEALQQQYAAAAAATAGPHARAPRARRRPPLHPTHPPDPPGPRPGRPLARSDKQAIDCLKQAGWSVEGGIEVFFAQGMTGAMMDTRGIEQLYAKYKGERARGRRAAR